MLWLRDFSSRLKSLSEALFSVRVYFAKSPGLDSLMPRLIVCPSAVAGYNSLALPLSLASLIDLTVTPDGVLDSALAANGTNAAISKNTINSFSFCMFIF